MYTCIVCIYNMQGLKGYCTYIKYFHDLENIGKL